MYDGDIIMVKLSLMDAAKSTIDYMLEQDGDIVSLYHGEDAAPEQVDELEEYLRGRMSTGYAILQDIHGEKQVFKPIPKFSKLKRVGARKSWIVQTEVII